MYSVIYICCYCCFAMTDVVDCWSSGNRYWITEAVVTIRPILNAFSEECFVFLP